MTYISIPLKKIRETFQLECTKQLNLFKNIHVVTDPTNFNFFNCIKKLFSWWKIFSPIQFRQTYRSIFHWNHNGWSLSSEKEALVKKYGESLARKVRKCSAASRCSDIGNHSRSSVLEPKNVEKSWDIIRLTDAYNMPGKLGVVTEQADVDDEKQKNITDYLAWGDVFFIKRNAEPKKGGYIIFSDAELSTMQWYCGIYSHYVSSGL